MNTIEKFIAKSFKENVINISNLTWPADYNLNFFDIEVSLKHEGQIFGGRGGSFHSKDHALEVAFTEAYERICVRYNKLKNSNGVAAHVSVNLAQEGALLESIERTLFFIAFYSTQKFGALLKSFSISGDIIYQYLLGIGTYANQEYQCVLTVNRFAGGGAIVGLGCSQSLDKAILKSEIEMYRLYAYIKNNYISPLPLSHFLGNTDIDLFDHTRLFLNSDLSDKFLPANRDGCLSLKFENLNTTILDKPKEFEGLDLFAVHAKLSPTFDLFVGAPTSFQHIEMKKLGFDWDPEMNDLPHPLA